MEEIIDYLKVFSGPNQDWKKKIKPISVFNLGVSRQSITSGGTATATRTPTENVKITGVVVSSEDTPMTLTISIGGTVRLSYVTRADGSPLKIRGSQMAPLYHAPADSAILLSLKNISGGGAIAAAYVMGIKEPTFSEVEVEST